MVKKKQRSSSTAVLWVAAVVFVVLAIWWLYPREEEALLPPSSSPSGSRSNDTIGQWRALLDSNNDEQLRKVVAEISVALDSGSVQSRPEALQLFADACRKLKDTEKLRAVLEQILREYPNSNIAAEARVSLSGLSGRGVDLYIAGQYDKALVALGDRLETAPDAEKPEIYFYLARSHDALAHTDKAVELYEHVQKNFPDTSFASDSSYRLSAISFAKGDYAKSLELFKTGLLQGSSSDLSISTAASIAPGLFEQFVVKSEEKARWNDLREVFCTLWRKAQKSERPGIEKKLDTLNAYVVFSQHAECTDSEIHRVVYGDSLGAIARKYGVRVSRIMRINKLKDERIFPDQLLKIVKGKATVIIDKSDFTLVLLLNNKYLKSYAIGIGKGGLENDTPIGHFKVTSMDVEPTWYKDGESIPFGDPRNILGTRWLGLNIPHYGIHGTSLDDSIGKASSAGCIRMHNPDVEELYDFVSIEDPVIIED